MGKLATLKPRVATHDTRTAATWSDDQRIRGSALQAIRRAYFERHPLCVRCLAEGRTRVAMELDHIVPLHRGGIDSRDPFVNRQGLCVECHEAKSKREDPARV